MRWAEIETFLAIAREGTLADAGVRLGVNASTVWRRVEALEAADRVRLFDRKGGSWTLSEAGEAVLPHAERVEAEMLALDRALVGQDVSASGPVHATAPESLLPLLVGALDAFRVTCPDVSLHMRFEDRRLDLTRRESDVAIRPTSEPPEQAIGHRICGVAWARYALRGCADPESLPWALYSEAMAHVEAVRWRRAHHPVDASWMVVNTVPAMHQVLVRARCQGLLPCFVGDAERALVRLGDPIPEAGSALWVLYHADLRRTERVRRFVDHVAQALTAQQDLLEGRAPQ